MKTLSDSPEDSEPILSSADGTNALNDDPRWEPQKGDAVKKARELVHCGFRAVDYLK